MKLTLYEWAVKHQVSPTALHELLNDVFNTAHVDVSLEPKVGEAAVQQAVRIKASQQGQRLFRNNSGVLENKSGTPIRFGLGNDSKRVNDVRKSSDLIGITPIIIELKHVGTIVGRFTSYEIKQGDWRYNPNNAREFAQNKWHELINGLGGDSRFVSSPNDILTDPSR